MDEAAAVGQVGEPRPGLDRAAADGAAVAAVVGPAGVDGDQVHGERLGQRGALVQGGKHQFVSFGLSAVMRAADGHVASSTVAAGRHGASPGSSMLNGSIGCLRLVASLRAVSR